MAPVQVDRVTLDWLLSEDNPPVRFLTLTRLLGRPLHGREAREARARLGDYEPTRRILAARKRFWRAGRQPYQKYRGGYWQLHFLGEYLAPRDLPGVAEDVEFVLGRAGAFIKERPWFGIHCLNANLLRAMVSLGRGRDERVRAGLEHVAREVLETRGIPCLVADWSVYPTCRMALPKVLLALTCLPEDERTPAMKKAARLCAGQLLEHEVCRYVSPHARAFWSHVQGLPKGAPRSISLDPRKRAAIRVVKEEFLRGKDDLGELKDKAGWLRFGFPLHYNSDVLEAALALAQAGVPRQSPGVRRALDAILARRGADGRWRLDFTLNGKMIAGVEKKGAPSRWITLRALLALAYFAGVALPE